MRFRPRFSLATLFLVVTAICVWLAWNVRLIHERTVIAEMILSRHGTIGGKGDLQPGIDYRGLKTVNEIPTLWKLFGIKPIGNVWIPTDEFTPEIERRLLATFPELTDWHEGRFLRLGVYH